MTAASQVVRLNFSPAVNMSAAIKSFFAFCESKRLSQKTLDYYRYRLEAFQRFLEAEAPNETPQTITRDLCRAFITSQIETHSPATANHSVITLKAFFNYLLAESFLDSSPMAGVQKVRTGKRLVNVFSLDQVQALLNTCEKSFVGARDRAIITLLFDTGLRVSEACNLVLGDIDWKEQSLFVRGGKGDKDRLTSFGETTRQCLMRYLDRRGELESKAVFVTSLAVPLTRFRVAKIIEARGRRAGITGRCSPHMLRHTFAINYLRAPGADVFSLQRILGHTDLTMTLHYAELSRTDVLTRHRQFSPADRLQPVATDERRKRLR